MSRITVDPRSRTPIFEQIISSVHNLVIKGLLLPDEPLPSVRALASELAINPNTIQKAFLDLDRAGIIVSTPGRGCFVAPNARERIRERLSAKIADIREIAIDLAHAGIDEKEIISAVKEAYAQSVAVYKKGE